jgi:hypothetical protein
MFVEGGTMQVDEEKPRKKAIRLMQERGWTWLIKNEFELACSIPFQHAMKFERDTENSSRVNEAGAGKTYAGQKWISNDQQEKYMFLQGGRKFMVQFISGCRN